MDPRWLSYLPSILRNRLSGRYAFQAVIHNSGWLLLDKFLRLVVGISLGVWLARYLGPNLFGQINFAVAFVSLFAPIAMLGLDAIVVRELVRCPEQRDLILGSAFRLKLMGAVIAIILAQVAIRMLRPDDALAKQLISIVSIGLLFQSLDVFEFWFQSQVQAKYAVYVRSSSFLVLSAVKVWLIITEASLIAFIWSYLAETVCAGVGLFIMFRRLEAGPKRKSLALTFSAKMKTFLTQSWPLMLSGLAVMVYFRIDQVMLAQLSSQHEVGLYSAALRISEVWYAIPTVLIASVSPSLIDSHGKSLELYYERLQKLFTLLARIAYAVAIPTTLLATSLVPRLYGHAFDGAGFILTIHIWTALFVFLGIGLSPWIVNEGMTRFYLYQTSVGAVTNVLLNLILIPTYGGIGAAVATLISQMVTAYLMLGFSRKTRRIFLMQTKAIFMRSS